MWFCLRWKLNEHSFQINLVFLEFVKFKKILLYIFLNIFFLWHWHVSNISAANFKHFYTEKVCHNNKNLEQFAGSMTQIIIYDVEKLLRSCAFLNRVYMLQTQVTVKESSIFNDTMRHFIFNLYVFACHNVQKSLV